ncbi:reverse transcriptase [Holotrichia oblita]|uniref:Reverse transcriptase n=1 Tax=Holotrichia oblita TaxID=644536 RepID=A0ACB9TT47_HOLOL|nr:reverse transcriptase [Holotrichia oblita]
MSPTKEREARLESNREDMKEVNSSFAKVLKRTKELEKLVKESTKTKVEIKHMTRELAYLVNNLEKSINKYQAQHDCIQHKRHTKALEVGTQTETVGKSVGIQAERSDIELERQKVEAEIRNEFKMALDSDSGFAGLTKLLDQKWPEDMFERTRVVYAGGADLNTESDLALLIDPARVREDKAVYGLLKIHPDLGDVTEKSDGHLDYMVKTVATRTRNQETSERTTAIYILPLKIDVEGVNHMEIVYDMMKELRLNVHIHPTDKIRLFLGEGLNAEYVRKMTEFIFHGLGINFTLVTSSGTPKAPQNSVGKPAAGKVVVKCGSSTYADLLKTVKEKVDLRQVGVNIKAIKKTARGDLMLEVDGDVRKADTLKQAISKNIDNEVNIANKMVTIHVLDIDATTTKNEVEEVIRRAVNSELMTGNIDRGNAAMDLMYKVAEEEMADIVIMAEPTPKRVQHSEWIVDNRTDVAIRIRNKNVRILNKGLGDGYVWVETQGIIIYGCYISPNINLASFTNFQQNLRRDMKKHQKEILVGGDFNAKSYLWGSAVEDKRGKLLAEWMAEDHLIVHNRGDVATFVRGNSRSYIDLTFSTRKIAGSVINWRVIEDESLSFHRHITYEYREERIEDPSPKSKIGWRVQPHKMDKMTAEVGNILQSGNETWSAESLASAINIACNRTFAKKRNGARRPVYWWTDNVAEARKNCIQKRRAMVRSNKGADEEKRSLCHTEYIRSDGLSYPLPDIRSIKKMDTTTLISKILVKIPGISANLWWKARLPENGSHPPRKPYLLIDNRILDPGNLFIPVKENTDLTVSCVVDGGNPRPTLSWELTLGSLALLDAPEVPYQALNLSETVREQKVGARNDARLERVMRTHHNATLTCIVHHIALLQPLNVSLLLDVQCEFLF